MALHEYSRFYTTITQKRLKFTRNTLKRIRIFKDSETWDDLKSLKIRTLTLGWKSWESGTSTLKNYRPLRVIENR